jgi:hypothetical protein
MTDENHHILKELHILGDNVAEIRKKIADTDIVSVRADQIKALCIAVSPIKCHSCDCMFYADGQSCFINPWNWRRESAAIIALPGGGEHGPHRPAGRL